MDKIAKTELYVKSTSSCDALKINEVWIMYIPDACEIDEDKLCLLIDEK